MRTFLATACLGILALAATAASAVPIDLRFAGTISSSTLPGIAGDAAGVVRVRYDDTTVPEIDDPVLSTFQITSIGFMSGTRPAVSAPFSTGGNTFVPAVGVFDAVPDRVLFAGALPPSFLPGYFPSVHLEFLDPSGTVVTSIALTDLAAELQGFAQGKSASTASRPRTR